MSEVRHFDALERVSLPAGPVHLAIGMFDGVHRGHQAVIRSALEAARPGGGVAGVLTFEPHPSAVLRPEAPTRLIHAPAIKRRLLERLGIDFLIEHPFTREFASTTARDFVARLKEALPELRAVYVGENFRFGRGREGDVGMLAAAAVAAGFACRSLPRLSDGAASISSSRLRELIASGAIEQANALLGYAYFAEGVVTPGRRIGRTLGFPTLNIAWSPGVQPAHGVYAVRIAGADGRWQPAVANYGLRPTVESEATEPRLEVHVLDATPLTYGDPVTVQWLRFLRPERKFGSLEALRAQVGEDGAAAGAALAQLSEQNFPNGA